MNPFAHSKGPFATWKDDEPKRIAFLTALGAVVADTVQYGVAATVFHNGFSRAADSYDLRSTFKNEYVLAGRACVEGAKEWMHAQGIYNSPQLLRQEFEDGDEGKGALSDLLEADGFRRPNFEPSRDNAKGDRIGVVQLQAADFLAYEVMQVYTMVWPPTEWPPRFRESSRVVLSIDATDVEHMIWDYSSVAAECERRGIMRHGDGEGRNREDPTHS